MPVSLPIPSLSALRSAATARRTRRSLFLAGAAVCLLFGLVYHVAAWYNQTAPAATMRGASQLVVLGGYVLLWLGVASFYRQRSSAPISVLWTTALAGVLALALGGLVWAVGPPEHPDFDGSTVTLASVVRMHVLSFLEVGFFFFLLARLRQLVLFKRTRKSWRNWHLMLGLMLAAALTTLGKAPGAELGLVQAVFVVPAVVFMVANAFRLSWITFLPFREKMICMGLSWLLVVLLIVGEATSGDGFVPGSVLYLDYYSYPLSTFVQLAMAFGVLYATTALLSLLFHLPTTGDFQRKADETAAMHSLTHLVGQAFDRERLVSSIAAAPVEAGAADCAWLVLDETDARGDGAPNLCLAAVHGLLRARAQEAAHLAALYDEVGRTRAHLLLDDAAADGRVHAASGSGFDSLLAVPLIARDRPLGMLVAAREVAHGFEQDDVEAVRAVAAQAALALDHAHLFEEQIEKERLARELDIAREVQKKLLPRHLPHLSGLTLSASSVSAQEVGGDYYDFIALDENRLSFIVADVSGKGTSAAFYMAEMQGVFQSGSRLAPRPSDFLGHANEVLAGALERSVFISVIYGTLDAAREELVLARAGHCPAALINLHGEARFLRSKGLGLGLDKGPLFRQTLAEERLALQPGDVLVLYTDGVVESRSPEGEEYGYERLLGALREHRHEDADALHDALLGDLRTFIGRDAYDDDMTLVVLKWHGLTDAPPSRSAPAMQQPAPLPPA